MACASQKKSWTSTEAVPSHIGAHCTDPEYEGVYLASLASEAQMKWQLWTEKHAAMKDHFLTGTPRAQNKNTWNASLSQVPGSKWESWRLSPLASTLLILTQFADALCGEPILLCTAMPWLHCPRAAASEMAEVSIFVCFFKVKNAIFVWHGSDLRGDNRWQCMGLWAANASTSTVRNQIPCPDSGLTKPYCWSYFNTKISNHTLKTQRQPLKQTTK